MKRDLMCNDKVYEFLTNFGNKSKCHIRILQDEKKSLVIICSQMKSNIGGSVTNYVEEISDDIINSLRKPKLIDVIKIYMSNSDLSKKLTDLSNKLNNKKIIPIILDTIISAIKASQEYKENKKIIESILWIEHYPLGTGISKSSDTYALVNLSDVEPNWVYYNPIILSKITGYDKKYFVLKSSTID